jgi:ATP-dependent Clp protease ATP-binding subunit ClpB
MFQPLTREEIRKVVELQIRNVQNALEKNNIKLTVTKRAVDYIADTGYDPQFGARPIKRVIQRSLLNELSKMILDGKVDRDSVIVVDEKNGGLVFRNG